MRRSDKYQRGTGLFRLRRQLPKISKDIGCALGCLAAISCLAFLMVFAVALLLSTPALAIREIEVGGLKELTEKDIFLLTGIQMSRNILAVNLEGTVRKIKGNPWVREVSISRRLPGRLQIDITERKARAILRKTDTFFLVDESAFVFMELCANSDVNLPVITGWSERGQELSGLSLSAMLELIGLYEAHEKAGTIGILSEVKFDENLGITMFNNRGVSLFLGFDNFELKFKRFMQIKQNLADRGAPKGFLRIDLSDPDKAAVSWREVLPPKQPVKTSGGLKI